MQEKQLKNKNFKCWKEKKSYTCYKAFRVGIFVVITFAQYKTR